MVSRTIKDPYGQEYRVRVRWLPRRRWLIRRFRFWRPESSFDRSWVPSNADDPVSTIVLTILVVFALVVLFFWLVLPLILLVVDIVVVLLLFVGSVLFRVLFRRPWSVVVSRDGTEAATVGVVGRRRALRVRDRIADALRSGASLENAMAAARSEIGQPPRDVIGQPPRDVIGQPPRDVTD